MPLWKPLHTQHQNYNIKETFLMLEAHSVCINIIECSILHQYKKFLSSLAICNTEKLSRDAVIQKIHGIGSIIENGDKRLNNLRCKSY